MWNFRRKEIENFVKCLYIKIRVLEFNLLIKEFNDRIKSGIH